MPKERIISGLDIGSTKICTIIANVSDEGKVSVIGVSSTPSKGIKKGVVVDIDEAVEAIAQSLEGAERMAGYAVSNAFVTVDGGHISSLNSHGVVAVAHQDTEINDDDIARVTEAAQAISIPSSREIIHVVPRGFTVDAQEDVKDPRGMSGIRLEVETNIISGSATAMRNLVKCVQQVGVDVEELVYGGLAAAESALTDTEKELGTAVIDIGGGTTDILLFINGSPAYSAVLPIGGQNITNDLAIGLRSSLENAEKLKLRLAEKKNVAQPAGLAGLEKESEKKKKGEEVDVSDLSLEMDTVPRKFIEGVIKARISEIFNLVALEIKKSGYSSLMPAGSVICGGASETASLESVAKSVLRGPVRVGRPKGVTGLIEEIGGPAYSASVGLVLYGASLTPKETGIASAAKGRLQTTFKKGIGWFKSFLP